MPQGRTNQERDDSNMKYSVIIPVYNCACYLESCVESVLRQKTDAQFEIILVDDGSVDGSGELCDRLAATYEAIRVIHQSNQGVSAARNAGLQEAWGAYVFFLDGDDLWHEDLLQLVDAVTEDNPDVVQFGYRTFYESGQVADLLSPPVVEGETGKEYLERILDQGIMPVISSCTSAYRKEFLHQNDLRFSLDLVFGEDMMFRIQGLLKTQKLRGVDAALYLYRRNTASATRNMTVKKMQDICTVWPEFYRQFPKTIISNYYCLNLVGLAELSRSDTRGLLPLLRKNKDVLATVRGTRAGIARLMFRLFGYYHGAKIVKLMVRIKNR